MVNNAHKYYCKENDVTFVTRSHQGSTHKSDNDATFEYKGQYYEEGFEWGQPDYYYDSEGMPVEMYE